MSGAVGKLHRIFENGEKANVSMYKKLVSSTLTFPRKIVLNSIVLGAVLANSAPFLKCKDEPHNLSNQHNSI